MTITPHTATHAPALFRVQAGSAVLMVAPLAACLAFVERQRGAGR